MSLGPGTRLGPYEIHSALGAGGMGEVYRARDMRLDRDVAIKVLPEVFASDPERLTRFEREAKTLAALNHPNIAQIYGVEQSNGTRALVMELVEGETLADRIARGPLPIDEALPIAKQIAEALEAAHEQGIIHRDLKPANIKVREDATVKVLDFGLAKLAEPSAVASFDPSPLSLSPTITSPAMMTGVGVLLGTAAYMPPEQARGKTIDRRADIWAFGVVLFEMLTGKRAFEDEDVSMTLSKVLQREPDFDALPPTVPAHVRQALRLCLRKDPKQRVGDIRDVRLAVEGAFEPPAPETGAAKQLSSRGGRLAWLVAAAAALVAVGLAIPAVRYLRQAPPAPPPETLVDIVTPATSDPVSFALSPDGTKVVFAASGDGSTRLWVRPLNSTMAQPLAGTEGARFPFWSPDNRSVAFFAAAQLKRVDLEGGLPRTLAPAIGGRGGAWNADGTILFAGSNAGTLAAVSSSGGNVSPATKLIAGQLSHRFPFFLPDGRHFLFYAVGGPDVSGVFMGVLGSEVTTRLTVADSAGAYLPAGQTSGWLLWGREGALVGQRLDVEQQALVGKPVTLVATGLSFDMLSFDSMSALSVSATGLVAYRSGGATRQQLTWFDRNGKNLGVVGAPDENNLRTPRLSPDGSRVAVSRTVLGNQDIWLLDGVRTSRLTFDAGTDANPVWSPDGRRLAFRSTRNTPEHLYVKDASGAGVETALPGTNVTSTNTCDWSSDGRFLLYQFQGPQTDFDLWVFPMVGDPKPRPLVQTRFRDRQGRFSPDGHWVAYMSDESGRGEIYLRPFSADANAVSEGRWQVSTKGGVFPVWRPDGRELYYLGPNSEMMAVSIATRDAAPVLGTPVSLFRTRIYGGGLDNLQGVQYDVARDGRFLINTELDDAAAPITLIQNWEPPQAK